jgi:cysteine desulfurase NifS
MGSGEADIKDIGIVEARKEEGIIYLDNNATTEIAREVKEYIKEIDDIYGNPSSIHRQGRKAKKIIEDARLSMAQQLNCTAKRIIFTGSGTESDNIAIKGVALAQKGKKDHIITSVIEHPAVLASCRWLETQGFKVSYLPVNKSGIVDPDDLKKEITGKTCLVTIMLANNETGSIQPVKELAEITRDRGIIFHTDAVQALGKIPVDVRDLGIDMLSVSAHKLNGPKGVGALYMRKGIELEYLIHGGGQESGVRSATENVPGIAGFGKAAELIPGRLKDIKEIRRLRNMLESGIKEIVPEYILNGSPDKRLPNTLNIVLPGLRGESIVLEAARRELYFSSGSACHSGSPKPSYVLLAIGLSEEDAHCSLRFSLGHNTTEEEILRALDIIKDIIVDSRNIIRFIPCK